MIPRLPHGFSHPMRIGSGAFASVYRARQEALNRFVALKFIYEKNRIKRHDLLKEAQTQASLRAHCVPDVYDAFEWQGSVCMVMEWVRGVSLAQLLSEDLDENTRLSIAAIVIDALAEIHQMGYAHRDLKPENIILSAENGLYLVDFGFSKNILEAGRSTATAAKGTPAYMAPELWSHGGDVDLMRSDVYACGRVLLQILSGTSCAAFTDALVQVNPLKRPASGVEVAALWRDMLCRAPEGTWKQRAGELTARKLSSQMVAAAKQLLYAHRTSEAYWLLVECLEEDSNNHEAVELLGTFQENDQKKRGTLRYALYAGVLLAVIAGAFFAGMQARGGASDVRWYKGSGPIVPPLFLAVQKTVGGGAVLKSDSLQTDLLEGRLFVRQIPSSVMLVIDGDTVAVQRVEQEGVSLGKGSHEVLFTDTIIGRVHGETVTLLPFQIKSIACALAYREQRNRSK